MTTRPLRIAFAFLIAGTLAATALPAGPLFESGDSPAAITAPDPLDLVARLWGLLTRSRVKNGCEVDPSGRCLSKNRPTTGKNGCSADPNGQCLPGTTTVITDNGCSVDPDGRCLK